MSVFAHRGIWHDRDWLKATRELVDPVPPRERYIRALVGADHHVEYIPKRGVKALTPSQCLYCRQPLERLSAGDIFGSRDVPNDIYPDRRLEITEAVILVCNTCGWWFVRCTFAEYAGHGEIWTPINVGAGMLYEFSERQHPEAIEEVRKFLQEKYESAKTGVHPKLFEDVVASMFRDLGYAARVTAYSGDDGIDIVLERESETIGVQITSKSRIKVEHIRAFAGALLLGGMTRGVYATTSDYQSGCNNTVRRYAHRGMRIDLVNGDELIDALRINRRPHYAHWSDLFDDPDVDLTTIAVGRLN